MEVGSNGSNFSKGKSPRGNFIFRPLSARMYFPCPCDIYDIYMVKRWLDRIDSLGASVPPCTNVCNVTCRSCSTALKSTLDTVGSIVVNGVPYIARARVILRTKEKQECFFFVTPFVIYPQFTPYYVHPS